MNTNKPTLATNGSPLPHRSPTAALIFLLGAALLIVITFLVARNIGQREGQRDAREKIEKEYDLTAGPKSLIAR